MKTFLLSMALLLSSIPAAIAREAPLPPDSVYQLQAQMVDQAGHAQAWRAQRGKPRLVSMFYTSGPYMCPLIVDSGKAVERQLTPAERDRIGITLVSLDPARDTPKALQALAGKRQLDANRWSLLAPRENDVRAIAGVLGVRYRKLDNGEFNHSSELILLDADGRILARSDKVGTVPDPEFVAQVRRALAPAAKGL